MSTLQWTVVSSFLYAEIGMTLLLILPLLKPSWWKRLYGMRIFSSIQPIWSTFFYSVLVILILLFLDSIRQQMKYGSPNNNLIKETLDTKIDRQLRECKGQRNYFITGFALFLMLVIRRLITILSQYAHLQASHEAVISQARSANAELSRHMDSDSSLPAKERDGYVKLEKYETVLKQLQVKQADLDTLKKQAEAAIVEYDRLSSDYQELQNKSDSCQDVGKKDV